MIGLPITLGIFFGLIFLTHMWEYIPAIYHSIKEPNRRVILLVEPSPFRRDESYVIGPYNPARAIWIGRTLAGRNPYTEVRFVPACCKIMRGNRVLYDGKTRE